MTTLTPADFGAVPGARLGMTNRQEATVIAALTVWRALVDGRFDLVAVAGERDAPDLESIASDFGLHDPLSADEVTELLHDVFLTA